MLEYGLVGVIILLLLGAGYRDHRTGKVHDLWGVAIAGTGLILHVLQGDPVSSMVFGIVMLGVGVQIHRSTDLGGADAVMMGALGFVFGSGVLVVFVGSAVAMIAYSGTIYLTTGQEKVRVVPALSLAGVFFLLAML